MTSKNILYSKGKNDECYTPDYGVKPILKYIPKNWVVWCPFDTEDSEFVKQISKTNKVIASHICNGQDFLLYEPKEHWDCIISNPPFTNKRGMFERALQLGKPFALIMSLVWLNDNAPKTIWKEYNKDLQLLMFEQRMEFIKNGESIGRPTFSSAYFCADFLPKQIIIEKLEL